MAIERRREAGGGGRPLPEENGSVPGAAAPPPGPPPAGAAEIQAVPPPAAACSPLLLDYDGSVLPFLGGLGGGYQRTLVLLTWVPALFIGFSKFSDSFLLDQPDFWCQQADGQGNWSVAAGHGNRSGNGSIFPPAALPTPVAGNASECDCHEWHYRIRAGLVQNVVSKVSGGLLGPRIPARVEPIPPFPLSCPHCCVGLSWSRVLRWRSQHRLCACLAVPERGSVPYRWPWEGWGRAQARCLSVLYVPSEPRAGLVPRETWFRETDKVLQMSLILQSHP